MFNSDQQSYMDMLCNLPPSARCWCGWNPLGECQHCATYAPGKTCADKIAVQCPECLSDPGPNGGTITHVRWCRHNDNPGGGPPPAAGGVLSEEQRQAVILALARLAVERPGWKTMLHEIAGKFDGGVVFTKFVTYAGLPPMSVGDSSNRFGLVRHEQTVEATALTTMHGNYTFTLFEAVVLAVWAAKLADPDLVEFHRLAKEITK